MSSDIEREAVLFIHSTGTGPFLWSGVPDEVGGPRRKLLPANLGYPPNPMLARGTRVGVEDDVAHVMASIPSDVERVHVVAHSYGALVGLHLLEALGERVCSAFLFEPVQFRTLAQDPESDVEAVKEAQFFATHPWFIYDEEKGGREEWLEVFIDYWNRPGSWQKLAPPMRELSLAVGWKMFQEVRACFFEQRPFDSWKIGCRTTIVRGERSPRGSRAMALAIARRHGNVTLVDLPGVGHMAPLTHATKVHEELARHLAQVVAR